MRKKLKSSVFLSAVLSLLVLCSFVTSSYAATNSINRVTEYFTSVQSGSQSAINNNLSNPLSAWKKTSATLKRYPWDKSISYDIRLEEMYVGDEAAAIVEEENWLNDKPKSTQQWILMKYYLKNKGTEPIEASDIVYKNYFYTNKGAKMQVFGMASFSEDREGLGVFDVELYGGASGYCWIGILVPKSAGLPYLQISNGYGNDANISWLNTNPSYVSTPTYKVTFNKNGGNTPSKSYINVLSKKTYGKLPTCTRKGYIFKGWYTKASGGTKVTDKTVCSGNATVYAQWTKVSVSKPSIYTPLAGSKSFTAKWKKISSVAGYQITYSTSSSFKSAKTVNVSSSATSKKVSSLSAKKNYYVKVRAYKKDSTGANIYGSWSSVKSVKTK